LLLTDSNPRLGRFLIREQQPLLDLFEIDHPTKRRRVEKLHEVFFPGLNLLSNLNRVLNLVVVDDDSDHT